MNDLARIVYISRATFAATSGTDGPGPDGSAGNVANAATADSQVTQILLTARATNQRDGLVGMLYYRDGCFMQCIEGERRRVHKLYRTLLKDRRHRDLKLLVSEPVDRLAFPEWPMKFVPDDHHMQALLVEHGFDEFDPYRFDYYLVERVLELMQGLVDPTVSDADARASSPVRDIQLDPHRRLPMPIEAGAAKLRRERLIISISLLALGVSLANLAYIIANI
ncbi:BLUF domain-containing protein [Pseudomonas saliphila]|uniref:BLUF domain-containing protein n=1 Tax=Pseudomonas saliphila TaxID=2586906 RepID=UPI00123C3A31|nr:BLUF domain-containing protein [Pseudomonas saliphila]